MVGGGKVFSVLKRKNGGHRGETLQDWADNTLTSVESGTERRMWQNME